MRRSPTLNHSLDQHATLDPACCSNVSSLVESVPFTPYVFAPIALHSVAIILICIYHFTQIKSMFLVPHGIDMTYTPHLPLRLRVQRTRPDWKHSFAAKVPTKATSNKFVAPMPTPLGQIANRAGPAMAIDHLCPSLQAMCDADPKFAHRMRVELAGVTLEEYENDSDDDLDDSDDELPPLPMRFADRHPAVAPEQHRNRAPRSKPLATLPTRSKARTKASPITAAKPTKSTPPDTPPELVRTVTISSEAEASIKTPMSASQTLDVALDPTDPAGHTDEDANKTAPDAPEAADAEQRGIDWLAMMRNKGLAAVWATLPPMPTAAPTRLSTSDRPRSLIGYPV